MSACLVCGSAEAAPVLAWIGQARCTPCGLLRLDPCWATRGAGVRCPLQGWDRVYGSTDRDFGGYDEDFFVYTPPSVVRDHRGSTVGKSASHRLPLREVA